MTFFILLFIVLLVLRSSGIVDWPWWIICLPLFVLGGLAIEGWVFGVFGARQQKKDYKEFQDEMNREYEREKQQVERNLKGIELEKKGDIDKAIELYEQNISENFIGNHPYDRLAIIYRKRNQIDDEIRALEKAVWVFKNIVDQERADRLPKLDRFKKRLQKAQKLRFSS